MEAMQNRSETRRLAPTHSVNVITRKYNSRQWSEEAGFNQSFAAACAKGLVGPARSRKKRAARAETLTAPCACVPQTDEVMDKLRKMLRMRGRTLSNDLLRVMEAWLRCGSGPDTFTAARACSPSLLSATPPNVLRSLGILRGP